MIVKDAKIYSVEKIEYYTNKLRRESAKVKVLMHMWHYGVNALVPFLIYKNKNYSFDIIKNFEANKFAVGDTVDFEYNAAEPPKTPTIWRMYNHKRTRDESFDRT